MLRRRQREFQERVEQQHREWEEELERYPQLRAIMRRSAMHQDLEIGYDHFFQRKLVPPPRIKVNWKQEGF